MYASSFVNFRNIFRLKMNFVPSIASMSMPTRLSLEFFPCCAEFDSFLARSVDCTCGSSFADNMSKVSDV